MKLSTGGSAICQVRTRQLFPFLGVNLRARVNSRSIPFMAAWIHHPNIAVVYRFRIGSTDGIRVFPSKLSNMPHMIFARFHPKFWQLSPPTSLACWQRAILSSLSTRAGIPALDKSANTWSSSRTLEVHEFHLPRAPRSNSDVASVR